jgi:hypothetical protein
LSNTQTIFLNGRSYDALTGKLLDDNPVDSTSSHSQNLKLKALKKPSHHRPVDGLMGHNYKALLQASTHKGLSAAKKHLDHHVAPHLNRLTEHSKTLMRPVNDANLAKLKAQQRSAKAHLNHVISKGAASIEPAKTAVLNQARALRDSDFVGKLNELTTPAHPIQPKANMIQTTANSEIHLRRLDQLNELESNPELDKIFNEASLKLSDSHQPTNRRELRFYQVIADKLGISDKLLFIFSIVLFLIIAGSVVSYIFSDNIAIYIADNRTGIHGLLPTFKPDGFELHSINYATSSPTGSVSLSYGLKKTPTASYQIKEQASSWSSQELATSVVQPIVGNSYQTYHIGGRSVFIYGQTAVWLDSGIYYNLTNHAGLTNSQINQIASST